ncbi:PREDICTED: uncharacterized protein LOC108774133 isoform X2 [Cyphomyrmex costatus]|uniref:uncharacterized protein LOC108774133 isoform X2 n=1 Tax=Cyphomyrmex costatus TaxID=456900 RepID=UPI0008524355|nr:PREDICTED: uncharacterized protein LOC108774133 isoform X2 [Cyphomyrmex costatus]
MLLQPQRMITAHDTLEHLSCAKRPAFNALWEPKNMIGIDVKATEKKRILGDKYLESIIKERPRIHMVPSVSLDDVQDKDQRKLVIDFIYKKTIDQATKEVWDDFKVHRPCLSKKHIEEREKPEIDRHISRLPVRFQGAARKWDSMQSRSFLTDDTCYDKKRKSVMYVEFETHKGKDIRRRTYKKINQ